MSGYSPSVYICKECRTSFESFVETGFHYFCDSCISQMSRTTRVLREYQQRHNLRDFQDLQNGRYRCTEWPHAASPENNAYYQAQFNRDLDRARDMDNGTYEYPEPVCTVYCQCERCNGPSDDTMTERYNPTSSVDDPDYPEDVEGMTIDEAFSGPRPGQSREDWLNEPDESTPFSNLESWIEGIENLIEDIWDEQEPEDF